MALGDDDQQQVLAMLEARIAALEMRVRDRKHNQEKDNKEKSLRAEIAELNRKLDEKYSTHTGAGNLWEALAAVQPALARAGVLHTSRFQPFPEQNVSVQAMAAAVAAAKPRLSVAAESLAELDSLKQFAGSREEDQVFVSVQSKHEQLASAHAAQVVSTTALVRQCSDALQQASQAAHATNSALVSWDAQVATWAAAALPSAAADQDAKRREGNQ